MELFAPVARLFLEQRFQLANRGLAQIDDVHGQVGNSATPAARGIS
jgi:hypothetical protein